MPSEKQIESVMAIVADKAKTDGFVSHREVVSIALTAAEQAAPLNNDVEVRRWQRATAVQSRKLQMVLDIPGVKERLQEVTGSSDGYMLAGIEQSEPCKNPDCGCMFPRDCPSEPNWDGEPAPAARSGAVKVKAVLELVQYHVTDDDDRATLTAAISALEPAEPATDAEPYTYFYRYSNPMSGKPVWRSSGGLWNGQRPSETLPLYIRPPESRLREALEKIANGSYDGLEVTPLPAWKMREIAKNALAQGADDERP